LNAIRDQNESQIEENNSNNELDINQSFSNCFVVFDSYVTKQKIVIFSSNGIEYKKNKTK
jgi:hypothetical protein